MSMDAFLSTLTYYEDDYEDELTEEEIAYFNEEWEEEAFI